jgi:hypothetical protein
MLALIMGLLCNEEYLVSESASLSTKVLNAGKCREFLRLNMRLPKSISIFYIIVLQYSEHTHK